MSSKLKRIFSAVLVSCMLVSMVPLNAISIDDSTTTANDNTEDIKDFEISENNESKTSESLESDDSSFFNAENSDKSEQSDTEKEIESKTLDENNSEEIELTNTEDDEENDNWELSLVFYDSSVNNGKTPLTEINWNAEDYYDKDRVIKTQINYRNTNVNTTYNPGDLIISIPILTEDITNQSLNISIGADSYNETQKQYDWSYKKGNGNYYFTNNHTIENNTNFEGSIQIAYLINPQKILSPCSKILKANLNDSIFSNDIDFSFQSSEEKYSLKITPKKPYSQYGFPSGEYIWVQYEVKTNYLYEGIRSVRTDDAYFQSMFNTNENCIILDKDKNLIEKDSSGMYKIKKFDDRTGTEAKNTTFYVGYPESLYSGKIIKESIQFIGYFNDMGRDFISENNLKEEKLIVEGSCNVNINDFKFTYEGDLYAVHHTKYNYTMLNSSLIKNKKDTACFLISPTAYYAGFAQTIRIGNDLFIDYNNGEYRVLEEDEYYIEKVNIPIFPNGNNSDIDIKKYNASLFVRYENETEYVEYQKFEINQKYSFDIDFSDSEKKIVAYYVEIYDMQEDLYPSNYFSNMTGAYVSFTTDKIKDKGRIYSLCYIQAFADGEFLNEPDIESYNSILTKAKIATYDIETYGHYMQRDYISIEYTNNLLPLSIKKSFENYTKDIENECFYTKAKIKTTYRGGTTLFHNNYEEIVSPSDNFKGYRLYDLLPYGMQLDGTVEIVFNDDETPNFNFNNITHGGVQFTSKEEYINFIKENTTINVKENWKNTGRTWIEIIVDFSDEPINNIDLVSNKTYEYLETFEIPIKIDFDDYLNVHATYKNTAYIMAYEEDFYNVGLHKDNGYADSEASDIDDDGDTTECVMTSTASISILEAVSTHQGITKQVKTDLNNYSTGIVESNYDSEYEYKLRVRIGNNDVTNLIIYDSIEEYYQDKNGNIVTTYGDNEHWNGEFLGVDTSYAESKGYKIKVYYSENPKAGNLDSDNSWKEYNDTINKSKIKSVAFEYLDSNGNAAKLPATTSTYVIIKMKSPSDENITSFAYNGFRTQWNAINEYGQIVDYITGINSNIVKVALYKDGYKLISGIKLWLNDEESKRPESIKINLLQDGKIYETTETNASKNWEYSFGYVPIMKEDGSEYEYSVEEEGIRGYITKYTNNETASNLTVDNETFEIITSNSSIIISDTPQSDLLNIVNIYYGDKTVNLKFTKWIECDEYYEDDDNNWEMQSIMPFELLPGGGLIPGEPDFGSLENIKLDKNDKFNFPIRLINQETGEVINGVLDNKNELLINNVPVGTYIIEEINSTWFYLDWMVILHTSSNEFKFKWDGYTPPRFILTIKPSIEPDATIAFEIVNNIDIIRFYNTKYDINNLFIN